jgi:hypothetical protein
MAVESFRELVFIGGLLMDAEDIVACPPRRTSGRANEITKLAFGPVTQYAISAKTGKSFC